MNTQSLPRPIPLQRPLALRLLDPILDPLLDRALTWQARLLARWAAYRLLRESVRAERELARLSPQTLRDIGAPQGLVGQRRWQEEHEAAQFDRLLNLRGW